MRLPSVLKESWLGRTLLRPLKATYWMLLWPEATARRNDVTLLREQLSKVRLSLQEHHNELGLLSEGVSRARLSLQEHDNEFGLLSEGVSRVRLSLQEHRNELSLLSDAVSKVQQSLQENQARVENALAEHRRHLQIRAVMDWIDNSDLCTAPLISVILPTKNRCELLRRAIDSVRAQSYVNWELLVIDDDSSDSTPSYLATVDDTRIRCLRSQGQGGCAARNLGLAHARGKMIAYLDDDNIMHPAWLKSIVWAIEQRPEIKVLYAAVIVDDLARINPKGSGQLPQLCFHPYDYHAVAVDNIADMSCIAHRADLPEGRFDESLREMGDWDLFLRLTREESPLALPVIACFYTTNAPNRLSYGPTHEADAAAVRRKNRR